MSILASELIFYGSANMPEADGNTAGGAIQTATRVIFDSATLANAPSGALGCSSSDADDTTQTLTITGRDAAGIIVTEALSLNGVTNVSGTQYFERILKAVVDDAHNGTVTLRDKESATIVAIESGVLTVRRPFYDVSSDAVGGSERNYYEKIFLKNTNDALALLSPTISESADPSENLTFAVANAQNDAETVANRQTAPSEVGSFSSDAKTIPNTNLPAGSGVGIWMKLTLAAGEAAAKTTYTFGVTGTSI
jgi:hypothetical protein